MLVRVRLVHSYIAGMYVCECIANDRLLQIAAPAATTIVYMHGCCYTQFVFCKWLLYTPRQRNAWFHCIFVVCGCVYTPRQRNASMTSVIT